MGEGLAVKPLDSVREFLSAVAGSGGGGARGVQLVLGVSARLVVVSCAKLPDSPLGTSTWVVNPPPVCLLLCALTARRVSIPYTQISKVRRVSVYSLRTSALLLTPCLVLYAPRTGRPPLAEAGGKSGLVPRREGGSGLVPRREEWAGAEKTKRIEVLWCWKRNSRVC
jgi:hypothetical protein